MHIKKDIEYWNILEFLFLQVIQLKNDVNKFYNNVWSFYVFTSNSRNIEYQYKYYCI